MSLYILILAVIIGFYFFGHFAGYLKKAMIWIQSQHHYKHKGNIKEQKLKTA
jgi:hypothetical protein